MPLSVPLTCLLELCQAVDSKYFEQALEDAKQQVLSLLEVRKELEGRLEGQQSAVDALKASVDTLTQTQHSLEVTCEQQRVTIYQQQVEYESRLRAAADAALQLSSEQAVQQTAAAQLQHTVQSLQAQLQSADAAQQQQQAFAQQQKDSYEAKLVALANEAKSMVHWLMLPLLFVSATWVMLLCVCVRNRWPHSCALQRTWTMKSFS